MRILFVQFGNYAFAVHRFARGEDETFYAQRYTVDYVANLPSAERQVQVLALAEDLPLERLPNGVESLGVQLYPKQGRPRMREVIAAVEAFAPTHIVLCSPLPAVMRWAIARDVHVLPLLADSFCASGLRPKLRYFELAFTLNHRAIRWVSNHGPNASADLVRIGVDASKVVPFDWPALVSPAGLAPKTAPSNPRALSLMYAGQLVISKGVGDLLDAVGLAKTRGEQHRVTIAGTGGDADALRAQADKLGITAQVEFTGRVAHKRVLELMRQSDAVIVPSRHEYPEGMPMTIYEGLASRTPVVISDHPMFRGRVLHRQSAMIFEASNPAALLASVNELANDKTLYERLSKDADLTCEQFFGPLKWDQLLTRWLANTPDDDKWLSQYALSAAK